MGQGGLSKKAKKVQEDSTCKGIQGSTSKEEIKCVCLNDSDTGEKEERETKDKVEGCVQEGHADCRTERGRCRRQGLLERDDQQP